MVRGRHPLNQRLEKGESPSGRGTHRNPQPAGMARKLADMAGHDAPDSPSRGEVRGEVRGDVRSQLRDFLTTRRARISPEQAKLPVYRTGRRRVAGLRREEVALLAGISSEYYIRLERGNATGISESVIDGIVYALQLDEGERRHLLDLLRTARTTRSPRRQPARQRVRPTVQRVID